MSFEVPSAPPAGWCNIILACGSEYLLPGVPPAKITAPAEAASPIQTVATSGLMYFIVS